MDVHFTDLLSSEWQNSTSAIDIICATLKDYFGDYQSLKKDNFERVISLAQNRSAKRYITSMLQNNILRKKINLKETEDRRKAADKIKSEAHQIKCCFDAITDNSDGFESPFDAIDLLAEVLKGDKEMLVK